MKSGDKIYITVCTSTENYEVCAPTPFENKEDAIKDVQQWYEITMKEYTEDGECYANSNYENGDDYAYIEHDGEVETCQVIEVTIP